MLGDKITQIGGKSVEQIIGLLESVLSNENNYYVQYKMQYSLKRRFYLRKFNLVNEDNEVDVEFVRDGEVKTTKLAFKQYSGKQESNDNWVSWSINNDNDLGYLKIDRSKYDDYFKTELKDFFAEVAEAKVNNVVIDLRECGGGSCLGMEYAVGFLKNVNEYTRFGHITKVKHKEPYNTPLKEKISEKLKFDGDVYILTSKNNFSASNVSLIIWQDNGFATLVGEPSSNKADSYTQLAGKFYLPHLKSFLSVPVCYTLRPDRSKKDDIAVFPDYEVYTTIEDVKQGRDPQMEKVYELIKDRAKKGSAN